MKPKIGVLFGDPSGIGPEIAAKLLALPETHSDVEILIFGDPPPEYAIGIANAESGAYVLGTLRTAAESIKRNEIDALVYAPLNKQAMKLAGMMEEDEMHYLANQLGYTGYMSEINVCDGLFTIRVTSHVPLSAVAGLITHERILNATRLIHRTLVANGYPSPRIAVAALNPHAGEGGLMGTEEITTIGPAIEQAKVEGIAAEGPFPADTVFLAARAGRFDAVVTMYHDQGQIATKLLGFDRGVTIHGGLPLPVTTPAHGTAFDIAGKGIASVNALREAFGVAVRNCR